MAYLLATWQSVNSFSFLRITKPILLACLVGLLSCPASISAEPAASTKSAKNSRMKVTVTVGAKKPQLPDYFPVKVGDWWLYRSITADGKQSEFTLKVLNRELQPDMSYWYVVGTVSAPWAPIKDWYTKPKGWVVVHREAYPNSGQSVDFLPVRPLIMNPLKAGQVWHWSGPGMLGVSRSEKNEVLGPEEVMVPAGKFTAMKVVTSVVQGGAPVSKVYWYAPFVGLVKSMTESSGVKSSTVLLDYNFRKRTMPEWAAEVGVETSKQEYKLPPCEE